MELPDSLPAQLYLLTYDPEKERMAGWLRSGYLGPALRAAALLELLDRGRIADENGKVVLGTAPGRGAGAVALDSPVLARVVGQLESSRRPRTWRHWVGSDQSGTTRATRDYLESGRWLRVDRDRVLGLLPRTQVTVRDSRSVKALRAEVLAALRGPTAVDRLDRRARVLAALAALAEIRVLAGWREARSHRHRVAELAEALGPCGPALRSVVRSEKAARASGGGG